MVKLERYLKDNILESMTKVTQKPGIKMIHFTTLQCHVAAMCSNYMPSGKIIISSAPCMKIYDKIDDVDVWKLRQSLQDPSVQGSRELVTLWGTIPLTILRKIVCHLNSSKTRSTRSKSTAITSVEGRGTWKVQLTKKHPKNIQKRPKNHGPNMSESIRFPGHDRFAGSKRMARAVASRPWDPMDSTCSHKSYKVI